MCSTNRSEVKSHLTGEKYKQEGVCNLGRGKVDPIMLKKKSRTIFFGVHLIESVRID